MTKPDRTTTEPPPCPACGEPATREDGRGKVLWLSAYWHSECVPRHVGGRVDLFQGHMLVARTARHEAPEARA